jgi:hypothetical protein
MKHFAIIITVLLTISIVSKAQTQEAGDIVKIWSYPVVYNYDEQVSWYFDLAGTTFADGEDVYIWIWSPSEPDAGNWENSSEFAKLSYVGDMVWRFDVTPTLYFSRTPDQIRESAGFWLRLKDKTGSKQSGVSSVPITDFSAFATSGELISSYPARPAFDAPLSILFNSNLATGFENPTSIHMHGGLNDWEITQGYHVWIPAAVEKTKLKDMGDGFFKMDLIPSEYFGSIIDDNPLIPVADEDYLMENMTFLFVKNEWAGTIPDQKLFAADVVIPPPPALRFFPMKVSRKDILGIIRTNNERGINKLVYTISAGTKVIEGEFSGNKAEIKGFVSLVTELEGLTGLDKINVVIKDNNDRVLTDTDIPLVDLNQ